ARRDEARQDANRRRLSRAVWAEKPDDLAFVDFEVDLVQGSHGPELFAQAVGLNHHVAHDNRTPFAEPRCLCPLSARRRARAEGDLTDQGETASRRPT